MSLSPVVTGVRDLTSVVRSPTESELPRAFEHARAMLKAFPLREGERMFVSYSRWYKFQLTCPRAEYDGNGHLKSDPPKVIRFDSYIYRTSDPFEIEHLTKDRFYGKDFWDAVEKVASETDTLNNRLLHQIKDRATPEQVAKIIAELQPLAATPDQKSFNLPKRETGAKTKATA